MVIFPTVFRCAICRVKCCFQVVALTNGYLSSHSRNAVVLNWSFLWYFLYFLKFHRKREIPVQKLMHYLNGTRLLGMYFEMKINFMFLFFILKEQADWCFSWMCPCWFSDLYKWKAAPKSASRGKGYVALVAIMKVVLGSSPVKVTKPETLQNATN